MKARQAKGWTQQELATKMSAKVSVVQEYENGKCVPQPQVIQQLQRALGVQVCVDRQIAFFPSRVMVLPAQNHAAISGDWNLTIILVFFFFFSPFPLLKQLPKIVKPKKLADD